MVGKTPWRITIDTNPDQCNLKCIMCDTHSIYNKNTVIKRQRMDPNILNDILEQAISLGVKEIIPSTMGEPLLYPHFKCFIDKLKNSNTKLNLTTNGTFPKKGAEAWARELLPITSDTKISINAISKNINEAVMINADTDEALKNTLNYLKIRDELKANNVKNISTVTLQVTFMHMNLSGIKEVIQYAIAHNVDRVKGHHLWVTHPELMNENLRNPEHQDKWNNFIEDIKPYRTQINLENFEPLLGDSKTIVPDNYECPFLNKEIWIDYDGNYNVCCAPSDKRKSLGDFGNIKDIPINSIFSTDGYQYLLAHYKTQLLCQNCLLRKPI